MALIDDCSLNMFTVPKHFVLFLPWECLGYVEMVLYPADFLCPALDSEQEPAYKNWNKVCWSCFETDGY